MSRAAWRMFTTTPLPRALRALPRGKTQRFVPDSSPVSLVEPSLQSSRCWENWKRSSRAFLAQETRRRCGQKRERCQEPAAGEKRAGGEPKRPGGAARNGSGAVGWERREDGSPGGTSRAGSPAPSPTVGASRCQGWGVGPADPAPGPRSAPTHVGEGEFAQHRLVALPLHLLHQRADHQLGVQAWKPGRAR